MTYDHVVPRQPARLPGLGVITREALAFARQATLLHRDWTARAPDAVLAGEDVVVVLHGLFATAGVLRPIRKLIEARAPATTAAFTYAPGPGVHELGTRLGQFVSAIEADVRIHLLGHSLGGVVARWYVQELGGDPRVVQSISLGSPFNGTRRARLMPGAVGRDILPGSEVLSRLRDGAAGGVPHLSVAAREDTMVTEQAVFHHGERALVQGCGHNGLLYDERVAGLVVRRIRESRRWM
ncbi:MAG: hypothetical protein KF718_11775 [Polyangiaceae bacterium]|nr:hypothetical protein [Polyangiaceae bacterium]